MKSATVAVAILCATLFCGAANADTVTLNYTMDYEDEGYFAPPDIILDHSPWYRTSLEDWGWTHDLVTIPSNATGIVAASVTISAWDVDAWDGQVDIISANGVQLGYLSGTSGREWGTTTFDLPTSVLDDLWEDGSVYISIDIDSDPSGHRVTLGDSVLSVTYSTGAIPEPATVGLLGLGALMALKRRRHLVR